MAGMNARLITEDGTVYHGRILSGDGFMKEKSIVLRFELKPAAKAKKEAGK